MMFGMQTVVLVGPGTASRPVGLLCFQVDVANAPARRSPLASSL